jgi:hypothetical protein
MPTRAARRAIACFTLAILACGASWLFAQTPAAPVQPFDAQDTLPLDPAVRTGSLPNGLKYFIRHNARPAQRVSLRLVVKSGSLQEADDQQGLAHFIEHMAFNGSAHFEPGELVSYFESTGARLGPHVNAYTGFDETGTSRSIAIPWPHSCQRRPNRDAARRAPHDHDQYPMIDVRFRSNPASTDDRIRSRSWKRLRLAISPLPNRMTSTHRWVR